MGWLFPDLQETPNQNDLRLNCLHDLWPILDLNFENIINKTF